MYERIVVSAIVGQTKPDVRNVNYVDLMWMYGELNQKEPLQIRSEDHYIGQAICRYFFSKTYFDSYCFQLRL